MKVELLYFTGKDTNDEKWYAARILAYSKSTRLNYETDSFDNYRPSPEELRKELEYMSSTIASSWEMIDLSFNINGISRACAQQVTRTRHASYAAQAQRIVKMPATAVYIPPSIPEHCLTKYKLALSSAFASYDMLIESGCAIEDARGVLPMHTLTNIIAKYNFRNWVDTIRARGSLRVQDEYRDIVIGMKAEVLRVWPWADTFIQPKLSKAIALLEELALELPKEQRTRLAKAADLLKKETA